MIVYFGPLVLVVANGAIGSDPRVILEVKGEGVVNRVVAVSKSSFSVDSVLKVSRQFLEQNHGMKLARLVIATNPNRAIANEIGKGQYHVSYEHWLKRRLIQGRPEAVAETMFIFGGGVTRIRDSIGRLKTFGWGQSDPLLLHAHAEFQLLHVHFDQSGKGSRVTLTFFLTTPKPIAISSAQEVTERICREFGSHVVEVSIQSNPWFIDGSAFPYVHDFEVSAESPTKSEYMATDSVYCGTAARCVRLGPLSR